MAGWLPPYINKHIDKLQKNVDNAKKKTAKAKHNLEYAKEYQALCEEQLAKALKKDENK